MAKSLKNFREFVEVTKRPDITKATVKRNPDGSTKIKLRGAHQEYTLTETDASRAKKIIESLGSLDKSLEVIML